MRTNAAWLIGYLTCTSALPVLVEALEDQNADVRYRAVEALAALHDRRAIEPLMKLSEDEDRCVRDEVARTLTVLRTRFLFSW